MKTRIYWFCWRWLFLAWRMACGDSLSYARVLWTLKMLDQATRVRFGHGMGRYIIQDDYHQRFK